MKRDFVAEARALPHHDFDLRMHGYLWRSFEPWFPSARVSALELGAFHGEMTKRIVAEFPDTTVVEASAECIAITKAKLPLVEYVHRTFETALLEPRYDAIFLIHSLEHVDDPVAVLERCREWLAPGGRLFVAVPNGLAMSRQIAVQMGLLDECRSVTEAERAHGHQRTYVPQSLITDIQLAGLTLYARGGCFLKCLANFQIDLALKHGVIDEQYLEGCFQMGAQFPDLAASIYAVCGRRA